MASERLQVILQLIAGQYKSEARQAASATGAIGKSAGAAGTATSGLSKKMDKLASGGLLGITAGAFAAKKGFDATIGAFAAFDDKMTESLAIMGDVSDEMRTKMSDAARDVAKTTTFSAEQAAESYFFLASAGLDAEQSIAAMPQVAAFAQAGMFDMALATDLATDAQSALGLTVDDASQNLKNLTRVTDVFVKANTLANTSVQQISEAFTSKAGAALRALNKDVEEGAAVLAAFADQGVKGAEAGTQFSIVLRDLQTKALANKDAFAQAGVAVFDASQNMRNLADIIGDIEAALEGMSDAEKKSTLLGLGFSDKSVAAITNLLGTSDAIREYEAALRQAGGTTEDVADKQLKSATKQWELFKAALADVGLELGENLIPLLEDALPPLQDLAEVLGVIADIVPIGEFFDSPIPDDIDERAADAAAELGLFERILVNVGRAAARFTPAGREVADVVTKAQEAVQLAETGFRNHDTALRKATSGYGVFRDSVGSADDAMLNAARRGEAAASSFKKVGDEAGTATPTVYDYADAIRDVHSALLEATDPVFASIAAKGRFEDAQSELEELRTSGEATKEELAEAELNVAETGAAFGAAQADLRSSGLEKGVEGIATVLEESYGHAQDLLEAVGILDDQDIVVPFRFQMSAADRALLNTAGNFAPPDPGPRGYGGGRAHGGSVRAGQFYRVGEGNRPELMLIPGDNGRVLSNSDMKSLIGAFKSGSDTGSSGDQHFHFHSSGDITGDVGTASLVAAVRRRVEVSRR